MRYIKLYNERYIKENKDNLGSIPFDEEEKGFIISVINRFGSGDHPFCEPRTFNGFRIEYLKDILASTEFNDKIPVLSEKGKEILKKIKSSIDSIDLGLFYKESMNSINEEWQFNFMKKKYEEFLGKKSEVQKHIETEGEYVTFGLLKSLWKDAIEYKNKRDLVKGGYKAIHRIVPIVGSFVFLPMWFIGTAFGVSRAFNKVMEPVLQNPDKQYDSFLQSFLHKLMEVSEGDIRHLIGDDWFYDAFMIEDDIIKMLKKDVILKFVGELSGNMSLEDDDDEVPDCYVENELRKFLNKEFKLNPGLPLK